MDCKPLVVVYEDGLDTLDSIALFLSMEGFRVIGVPVATAPPMAYRGAPDVMLFDIMLQGTSGIEHARELRRGGVACPMLAMSASLQMEQMARESGLFVHVLAKPSDMWDLARCLRDALGKDDGG